MKTDSLKNRIVSSIAGVSLLLGTAFISSLPTLAYADEKPITLKTMGSLLFGGTVKMQPNGETFHGDHGYAQYYIPQQARDYPLVMWHGIGQSGRNWETTPDGREGFMGILARKDWPVYIIDQPRRGRAGRTIDKLKESNVPTVNMETSVWDAFRNGIWVPNQPAILFPNVQFPSDAASIDQFFRQQTPDTGSEPLSAEYRKVLGETVGELFKQTGPAILITHSNSGQYGWATGMAAPENTKAIVAYEPGAFAFPEGECPADVVSRVSLVNELIQPQMVPVDEFKKLTKMPIIIIYGDNIAKEESDIFNSEIWRVASARAKQFVEAVNRHGGDAQLVILPEIGIKGNTHAPFADLNNVQIAEHLETFLHSKGLDSRFRPHQGPVQKKLGKRTIPLKALN
ncbi:alpha/beta fold hydrolase [Microvirga sp. W0021]|uniref:Alpha/beta fold hydrolase n=1 Tax=Hohaiivirga grylli TaxID=3133970 RepID=A0ABV0BIR9_9HYPH